MRIVLKRGNDQVVTLVGLRTTATPPVYLNTATVRATLLDQRGAIVQPFDEVEVTYIPDSSGDYAWDIEGSTFMIPTGVEYSLVLTAQQDGLDYRTVHVVTVVDA